MKKEKNKDEKRLAELYKKRDLAVKKVAEIMEKRAAKKRRE